MKFKYYYTCVLVSVLVLHSCFVCAEWTRQDIAVVEVGLSKVSQRIFVIGSPNAPNSTCATTNYYVMELGSPDSYLFYSAALTAMNSGKKIRVQYENDTCLGGSPLVEVFWNLNQ